MDERTAKAIDGLGLLHGPASAIGFRITVTMAIAELRRLAAEVGDLRHESDGYRISLREGIDDGVRERLNLHDGQDLNIALCRLGTEAAAAERLRAENARLVAEVERLRAEAQPAEPIAPERLADMYREHNAERPVPAEAFSGNTGHGHVFPRPDGVRARCGGAGICAECSRDLVRSLRAPPAACFPHDGTGSEVPND